MLLCSTDSSSNAGSTSEALACRRHDDAAGDVADVAVQQRLAASENHDRGAAFVDRVKAFGDAEPLIEDRIGIVDLAAASAGEIAAEQRFEHQHQRIAFDP